MVLKTLRLNVVTWTWLIGKMKPLDTRTTEEKNVVNWILNTPFNSQGLDLNTTFIGGNVRKINGS